MPKDVYENLMFQYYLVLNNAWKEEIKDAARDAIKYLSDLPVHQKINDRFVEDLAVVINQNLGNDFAAAVAKPTKVFLEKSLKYGLADVLYELPSSGGSPFRTEISIGLYGAKEAKLVSQIQQQHLFWIGQHFNTDIRNKFTKTLTDYVQSGMSKGQLADKLMEQFRDLNKSQVYWQGMAEHTSLRVRQFGRLEGYRKAGAKYYKLRNPMDQKTSDICRALVSENKLYPLDQAIEVRDKLLSISPEIIGLERAREHIKALAPWVDEKNIIYDEEGNPTGVSGAHTPFPPFHWKCRTETRIVL